MEFTLLVIGIVSLAIIAIVALVSAYKAQSTWHESIKGQLQDLEEAKVTHTDSAGSEKKSSVMSIIDLDLHIEHLHRGRCILQSGLLIVAVVAIICITVLCPTSIAPKGRVEGSGGVPSPSNGIPVNAISGAHSLSGAVSVAISESKPASTNQLDATEK